MTIFFYLCAVINITITNITILLEYEESQQPISSVMNYSHQCFKALTMSH